MSGDISIKRGTKVEDDPSTLDRTKMGVGLPKPPTSEVEGQFRYWGWVACPWDGAANYCNMDSDVYLWFTCWCCGMPFKA